MSFSHKTNVRVFVGIVLLGLVLGLAWNQSSRGDNESLLQGQLVDPMNCSALYGSCTSNPCCAGTMCQGWWLWKTCQVSPPPPPAPQCGNAGEACDPGCCDGLKCASSVNLCYVPNCVAGLMGQCGDAGQCRQLENLGYTGSDGLCVVRTVNCCPTSSNADSPSAPNVDNPPSEEPSVNTAE